MLKAKAVSAVLEQAVDGDVVSSMYLRLFAYLVSYLWFSIFTQEGSLIASSGRIGDADSLFSAVAANVWTTVQSPESGLDSVDTILLDCEVYPRIWFYLISFRTVKLPYRKLISFCCL